MFTKKALTKLIAVLIFALAGCKTTESTLQSSSGDVKYIYAHQDGHIEAEDIEKASSGYVKFSFSTNHNFNEWIKKYNPWGLYIFNTLRHVKGFVPGESFIEKITVKAKHLYRQDAGFANARRIAFIHLLDNEKAQALSRVSTRKDFLQRSHLFPGTSRNYGIGTNTFRDIEIKIPEYAQNENFFLQLFSFRF